MKPNHQAAELQFCRKISEIASIWGSKEWWATPKCGKVWPFRWKWLENCWTTKSWSWSQSWSALKHPVSGSFGASFCVIWWSGLSRRSSSWLSVISKRPRLVDIPDMTTGLSYVAGFFWPTSVFMVSKLPDFHWMFLAIGTISEAYSFVCCISHHISSYPCLKLRPFCAKANDAVRKGDRVPEACSRLPSTVFDSHSMSQRIGW